MLHNAIRYVPVRALFCMAIIMTFGNIPSFFSKPLYRTVQIATSLPASKDNTLYEDTTGSISNGAGSFFYAGKTATGLIRRAVIAFDVAGSIPAGSTIDTVTLTLNVSCATMGNETVSLHRLTANWGEGTSDADGDEGQGAPATTNDATWLHTFFNTSLWANVGGDFVASPSASITIGGNNLYTWGSTPQMVTDVQGWLDNPSTNFGWIIRGNEAANQTAKRFDSRQNATVANRPVLVIDYTLPASASDKIYLSIIWK